MKNKKIWLSLIWLPLIFLCLLCFHSCSNNTSDLHGTVYNNDGSLAKFVFLQLFAIDDRGENLAEISSAISDADGHFTFQKAQTPGSNMIAKAILPNGNLRGFAVGNGSQLIVHPLTEALVSAIINITSPSAGLSLIDFQRTDLQTLTQSTFEIDTTSIPLTDSTAVLNLFLSKLGHTITSKTGATITATTSASIEPANSLNSGQNFDNPSGSCLSSQFFVLSGKNYSFDVTPQGEICDGFNTLVNDTFDEAFLATISNDTFISTGNSDFPSQATITTQDTSTIVLGPETTTNTVNLVRKIYVAAGGDIVRFMEILTNNDSQSRSVDLDITGNLGSDDGTTLLVKGENDLPILEFSDRFAATIASLVSNISSVGFVWQDNNGVPLSLLEFTSGSDQYRYGWRAITLAPGQTKVFLHYAFIDASRDAEALRTKLRAITENPDMSNMFGSELTALQNFAPHSGNIVGAGGSVTQGATVTITNSRTGSSVSTTARSDWGFHAFLEAISGDSLTISASDGLSTTATVP
jgi:hypothetical protein